MSTQPLTTIISTESITSQITTITTQPLTTIISIESITTQITTITTKPITTQISTMTTELNIEPSTISTTILPISETTELNIKTTEPITTELKIINIEPITTIIENNIIESSSTESHLIEKIPTIEPFSIETEVNEKIFPEEYNKDPDKCPTIYNNKCYNKCPEGTCINQNDPSLMFCVEIKENSKVFNGICFTGIEEITNNIKSFSETNEVISTEAGIIIRGYSTKSENNDDILLDTKFSQIDLLECENKIKEYYNLSQDTELFILGIDSPNKNKNSSTNVYNYEIYLENGTKLEYSTACKDTKISISSVITNPDSVNLDEANYFSELGYDIYLENNSFYIDNCAPASIDGNDVTLSDRKKNFYPSNVSLCNESCTYISINFTTKRFTCECDNNYNFSNSNDPEENNEEEEDISYLDYFLSLINYKIIVCYELFYAFSSYYYNAGFYIAVGNLIFCLIQIVIFVKYGLKAMNQLLLESTPNKQKLIEAFKKQTEKRKELIKMELLNIKAPPKKIKTIIIKQLKENVDSFAKLKNSETNISDKNINNEGIKNNAKSLNKIKRKKKKTNLVKTPKIKSSSIAPINITREKKEKAKTYLPLAKKRKSTRRKSIKNIYNVNNSNSKKEIMKNEKYRLSLKKISINTDTSIINEVNYNEDKLQSLIKFSDDEKINKKELNSIPYTQALRIDKRNFNEILLSVLAHEIQIIDIFYYQRMYTHLSITLSIYVFELCLDLTLNCLLYTDDVVSEKYNNNGSIGFFTSLSLSFMSNIFASIIAYIVGLLADYGDFLELMMKDIVIKKQYFLNIIKFKKYLTLKLSVFFIIQAIINLAMCYYLMIFCTVYHKSQISIMINYIIGIAESIAISVGLTLIISILRYLSLKNRSKYMYYTSKYLFDHF